MTKIAVHLSTGRGTIHTKLVQLQYCSEMSSTQPYYKPLLCFGSMPQQPVTHLLPIAKDLTDLIERKAAEAAEHTTKVQNEKPWLVLERSSAGLSNVTNV